MTSEAHLKLEKLRLRNKSLSDALNASKNRLPSLQGSTTDNDLVYTVSRPSRVPRPSSPSATAITSSAETKLSSAANPYPSLNSHPNSKLDEVSSKYRNTPNSYITSTDFKAAAMTWMVAAQSIPPNLNGTMDRKAVEVSPTPAFFFPKASSLARESHDRAVPDALPFHDVVPAGAMKSRRDSEMTIANEDCTFPSHI